MPIIDYMRRWAVEYVKHLDAFERSIVSIKEDKDAVKVTHKKKTQLLLIQPDLDSQKITAAGKDDAFISVFTLNTRHNLDRMQKNWKDLSKLPRLKIFFTNPLAGDERKWAICPHVHARIADDDALRLGLQSMYQSVPEVTKGDLDKMAEES
jgi:hypothetical protein